MSINLVTYQMTGNRYNFGEYLAKRIVESLGYTVNVYGNIYPLTSKTSSVLLSIGGLLNNDYCLELSKLSDKIYVWGSGLECQFSKHFLLPPDVVKDKIVLCMLRGELTRQAYGFSDDILIGDPGYLASMLFPVKNKTDEILQVPFYYDQVTNTPVDVLPGVTKCIGSLLGECSESVQQDFDLLLQSIGSSKFVLTGSMHAAIVAHSYSVPWAIIKKSTCDIETEWKWKDTFSAIGLDAGDVKAVSSLEEGEAWYNSVKNKIKMVTKDYQNEILDAFPKEVNE